MQTRSHSTEFRAEQTGEDKYIEEFLRVWRRLRTVAGGNGSIDQHAFDDTLFDDIRALIDHETRLVLGRNKAGIDLRVDGRGLWGKVKVNPDDTDAMNLYSRVQQGDVSQCSFGFQILDEETEYREDGTVHWTIKKVKLFEVSVCTFPAYEDTSVTARKKDYEDLRARQVQEWKERTKERLKKWH